MLIVSNAIITGSQLVMGYRWSYTLRISGMQRPFSRRRHRVMFMNKVEVGLS